MHGWKRIDNDHNISSKRKRQRDEDVMIKIEQDDE